MISDGLWTMVYECGAWTLHVWKWWVFVCMLYVEGVVAVVAGPRPKIPVVPVQRCPQQS